MSQEPIYSPAPAENKKTNWVLIGCGGCLGVTLLAVIAVAGVIMFGLKAVRHSESYQTAYGVAESSPVVQERLGTPIKARLFFTGNVQMVNDQGEANYLIPIAGPKGSAVVDYHARLEAGKWVPDKHGVTFKPNEDRVDLLSPKIP